MRWGCWEARTFLVLHFGKFCAQTISNSHSKVRPSLYFPWRNSPIEVHLLSTLQYRIHWFSDLQELKRLRKWKLAPTDFHFLLAFFWHTLNLCSFLLIHPSILFFLSFHPFASIFIHPIFQLLCLISRIIHQTTKVSENNQTMQMEMEMEMAIHPDENDP